MKKAHRDGDQTVRGHSRQHASKLEFDALMSSHPTLHYSTDTMAARLPRVVIVIHSSPSSSQLPASVPMVSRSDE